MLIETDIRVGNAYKQISTGIVVEVLDIEQQNGLLLYFIGLAKCEEPLECRNWSFWVKSVAFLQLYELYQLTPHTIRKQDKPQLALFV